MLAVCGEPLSASEFPVTWEDRGIFEEFGVSAPGKWSKAKQSPRQFPNEQNREFSPRTTKLICSRLSIGKVDSDRIAASFFPANANPHCPGNVRY